MSSYYDFQDMVGIWGGWGGGSSIDFDDRGHAEWINDSVKTAKS